MAGTTLTEAMTAVAARRKKRSFIGTGAVVSFAFLFDNLTSPLQVTCRVVLQVAVTECLFVPAGSIFGRVRQRAKKRKGWGGGEAG